MEMGIVAITRRDTAKRARAWTINRPAVSLHNKTSEILVLEVFCFNVPQSYHSEPLALSGGLSEA